MTLKGCHIICSKDKDGSFTGPKEVWYSPSGGKKWDDQVSVGFILLPRDADYSTTTAEREWRKKYKQPYFDLSVISTSLTEQFSKNWNLELELPDFKPEQFPPLL